MEDVRKRMSVKFCITAETADSFLARNIIDSWSCLNEECVLFYSKKKSVKANKPISAGFSCLELSKYRMFHLFYKEIVAAFPNYSCTVCFTDTGNIIRSNKLFL